MILRYTDRSKDDVELAFAWYEKQRRGLGFEFLETNSGDSILNERVLLKNSL